MQLLSVLIILIAFGFLLWAINKFVPMQPWVKNLVNVVAAIIIIIWLLKVFGLLQPLESIRI